jgi:hypothetical protein
MRIQIRRRGGSSPGGALAVRAHRRRRAADLPIVRLTGDIFRAFDDRGVDILDQGYDGSGHTSQGLARRLDEVITLKQVFVREPIRGTRSQKFGDI